MSTFQARFDTFYWVDPTGRLGPCWLDRDLTAWKAYLRHFMPLLWKDWPFRINQAEGLIKAFYWDGLTGRLEPYWDGPDLTAWKAHLRPFTTNQLEGLIGAFHFVGLTGRPGLDCLKGFARTFNDLIFEGLTFQDQPVRRVDQGLLLGWPVQEG